ncbi:MAG: hypothetical protein KF790_12395 [Steroidobacteraceae bacterium]|jgi:hypothetical protein|nr:hypothetical protein [Steroidobacteraceae bacterium]
MQRAVQYLSPGESRSWRHDGRALQPGEPAPRSAVVAVVDFPDESYVLAKLPAMRGHDGRLLRRRRLEREFPGVSLALVQPLRRGREVDGNDAVLIAVPGGAALQDALGDLAREHALRAVTTPALLAGEWLRRARIRQRRVLIVLPTPAGVRLLFLDDGRPTLSRLTGPLAPQATAAEIARTVQYLQNTQRVARGESVELWFWGMDDATAAACLPAGVDVTPSSAPRVPGLPDPERDGLQALLALAVDDPGAPQLAPDELRMGWLARELERGSRLAAAAVAVLAILVAAGFEWRIQRVSAATADVVAQHAAIEQGAMRLDADLGRRGLTLAEVATLPEAEQSLAAGGVDPAAALAIVGVGFGAQQDVTVQGVELRAMPLAGSAEAAVVAPDPAEVPAAAADLDVAAACAVGPQATILVEFGLAEGLGVRRRDAALGWVREAAAGLAPWRAGAAARAIGRRDAVVVTADRDEARADARWAVCLRNEMPT